MSLNTISMFLFYEDILLCEGEGMRSPGPIRIKIIGIYQKGLKRRLIDA